MAVAMIWDAEWRSSSRGVIDMVCMGCGPAYDCRAGGKARREKRPVSTRALDRFLRVARCVRSGRETRKWERVFDLLARHQPRSNVVPLPPAAYETGENKLRLFLLSLRGAQRRSNPSETTAGLPQSPSLLRNDKACLGCFHTVSQAAGCVAQH